jgi:hypothetical protein
MVDARQFSAVFLTFVVLSFFCPFPFLGLPLLFLIVEEG